MNIHATLAETGARPRLLMCPPRHLAVTYSINPWMDPRSWAGDGRLHAEAERQWAALHEALIGAGAAVETIEPATGLRRLFCRARCARPAGRGFGASGRHHPGRCGRLHLGPAAAIVLAWLRF